jgi:[ribosomal protein S5]-alanine N-acetyltransferase
MSAQIESHRLLLRSMNAAVLEALLVGDLVTAGRLLECNFPADMSPHDFPLASRLDQLRRDTSVEPWLLRAMVERASGTVVGHVGFHTPPCPEHLASVAPDAVELGYSVHAPFRRVGYATEAVLALMHWAYAIHGQHCFFLSISPQNLASTAMAESLGFVTCGSHMDDEDGLEIQYLRRLETWPAEWFAKAAEYPRRLGDRSATYSTMAARSL